MVIINFQRMATLQWENHMRSYIRDQLNKNTGTKLEDILMSSSMIQKMNFLKPQQLFQSLGKIWQEAMGTWMGWENIGERSGIDIVNHQKKIYVEVANRYNSKNNDSKTTVKNRLAQKKKENPEYNVAYGYVNNKSNNDTIKKGKKRKNLWNGIEIEEYAGYELLRLIFEDKVDYVVNFLRSNIDKILCQDNHNIEDASTSSSSSFDSHDESSTFDSQDEDDNLPTFFDEEAAASVLMNFNSHHFHN